MPIREIVRGDLVDVRLPNNHAWAEVEWKRGALVLETFSSHVYEPAEVQVLWGGEIFYVRQRYCTLAKPDESERGELEAQSPPGFTH